MKIISGIILLLILSGVYSVTTSAYSSNNISVTGDSAVLALTHEILTALKDKDYKKLTEYFHPWLGVRFTPYGYIDTTVDVVLTKEKFRDYTGRGVSHRLVWGYEDGSGDTILMTTGSYFKKFVYDVDFLNAEKTSLNIILGSGNSQENIRFVYDGLPFTESYFSGFDEKLSGMDWRSLKLVYKMYENKYYLVAVIHSEWTI